MKKTILGIVGFFALMLASSAFTQRVTAPAVGCLAPALAVENTDSTEATSLSAYRGSYLLLSFWNSTQADSRLMLNQYQQWFNTHVSSTESKNISLMAVNLDSNVRMFEEIVKRDHLDRTRQFHINAEQLSPVIENFQLSAHPKSFLIDPEGRIVSINPTIERLNQL